MKFSTNQRVDLCLDKRGAPQYTVFGMVMMITLTRLQPVSSMESCMVRIHQIMD
jgi:hypothetical protein